MLATAKRSSPLDRLLQWLERYGNKLPDPALLFVILLAAVIVISRYLAPIEFEAIDPRSQKPLRVVDLSSAKELVNLLVNLVKNFTSFPPLGLVLVSLLGIGVAEHTGFVGASLRAMLAVTSRRWMTPVVILVSLLSHTAGDAGFVLVIPLGAVIYHAAGRHPLAGIAATFAGVSCGFSANLLPSAIDPLLQGFTQAAAQLVDPSRRVNPLCNWYFMAASCVVIVALGWWITDRVIEPRLSRVAADGEGADSAPLEPLAPREKRALWISTGVLAAGMGALALAALPIDSALRASDGSLASGSAPLMQSIVSLIFVLFFVPGIVYGIVAGSVRSHRDVVRGMQKSMSTMGYYMVLAFFAAQFIAAFSSSNLGALIALYGASALKSLHLSGAVTILGVMLLSAFVDLFIGSASAKWALMSPILIPMLMQLGFAPEFVQAGYRVGGSVANVVTPLMQYFPLVVVYCQRWSKSAGIGTLVSIMLPYSATFLVGWGGLLVLFWALNIPLGLEGAYAYP